MKQGRKHASTTVLNEYICIAGGLITNHFGGFVPEPLELYDTKRDEWKEIPPIDSRGSEYVITEWKGSLYAMGRRWGANNEVIKKFDPFKNIWALVCGLSVCLRFRNIFVNILVYSRLDRSRMLKNIPD